MRFLFITRFFAFVSREKKRVFLVKSHLNTTQYQSFINETNTILTKVATLNGFRESSDDNQLLYIFCILKTRFGSRSNG